MTATPLRIGAGGDVTVSNDTVRLAAGTGNGELAARIDGRQQHGGHVALGGWGITEALRHGATTVTAPGVTAGGLVTGPAAWHFGWERTDWDELAAAAVAGRILACADPGTRIEIHADGTFVVHTTTVDELTAHILTGLDGPELVEPDATLRLLSVRLAARDNGQVIVHSVRGLPAPATAVVERDEPAGWQATANFAVVGIDPGSVATRVWDVAGGAVEVRFTRRERPDPVTWADTFAELRATAVDPDPTRAEHILTDALAAIGAAQLPDVSPIRARPLTARPLTARRRLLVPTEDIDHAVVIGGERLTIPPAPTEPPPLARRDAGPPAPPPPPDGPRKVAPSVSTHPETIAALRDDLSRRRLAAGPADNDSVHWDAVATTRGSLGHLVQARSATCWSRDTEAMSVVVWAPTADAYDWLQWYLGIECFSSMLPTEARATVERIELPNLNALAFIVAGDVEAPVELIGQYVRAREVDLPTELYPSSALRTSAT